MEWRNRVVRGLVLATLTTAWVAAPALVRAAPAGGGAAATAVPDDGVVAEVNNDKILFKDLNRMVESLQQNQDLKRTLTGDTPAAKAALENWRQRILDNLITDKLMYQEALRRRITADPETVTKVVAQVQGEQTDDQFAKALAKEGLTPQYVRHSIAEELMRRELAKQLTADVTVGDDEVTKFYKDNPKEFTSPDYIRVRHILVEVKKNASAADKKKARDKAQSLLKKAQGGAEFATLAKENSDDPGSREQGGDLGPLKRDQFLKEFEDAAFAAPVGKVDDKLIETQFGYHVLKTEKVPEHMVPLAEVKDQLKTYLLKTKIQERLDQRITQMRTTAKIKKNI